MLRQLLTHTLFMDRKKFGLITDRAHTQTHVVELLPIGELNFTPKMLVLYETALGYCLFKLTDSAKLQSDDLYKEFESPEKASGL